MGARTLPDEEALAMEGISFAKSGNLYALCPDLYWQFCLFVCPDLYLELALITTNAHQVTLSLLSKSN